MKYTHITPQRDEQLYHYYTLTLAAWLKSGITFTDRSLIEYVLVNARPYYSIGYDYAQRIVHYMRNHGSVPVANTMKRAMWQEFGTRVLNALPQNATSAQVDDEIMRVLNEERASRFFVSYKTANNIINDQRRLHHAKRAA